LEHGDLQYHDVLLRNHSLNNPQYLTVCYTDEATSLRSVNYHCTVLIGKVGSDDFYLMVGNWRNAYRGYFRRDQWANP